MSLLARFERYLQIATEGLAREEEVVRQHEVALQQAETALQAQLAALAVAEEALAACLRDEAKLRRELINEDQQIARGIRALQEEERRGPPPPV